MMTYGATRAEWYKVVDNFKAGLRAVGIASKAINGTMFAKAAAKVLRLSKKAINKFLSVSGLLYDFLVDTMNGVLDKIQQNIRNLKKSDLYVFNLYVLYKNSTLFGNTRSVISAYTPKVAALV